MIFLLLIASLSASAREKPANKGCLNVFVSETFREMFKIRTDRQGIDYCDPSDPGYKIIEALTFVSTLDLRGPVPPTPYNQDIIRRHWWDWYLEKRLQILWGPSYRGSSKYYNGPSTCQTAEAFATPRESRSKIYLCPNLLQFFDGHRYVEDRSMVDIIATINHEVRHLEGVKTGFKHENCTAFKAKDGCDPNVEYKGAYAVGMES